MPGASPAPPTANLAGELARHWPLDPSVVFLNHGSFGACPRPVLAVQDELRARLEREPVTFLARELEARLDAARITLAAFIGADADDLAFVPNTTHGVNTVLRSLTFRAGDELLVTDHEYNACRAALDFVAGRSGARVVVSPVPFPLTSADEVVAALLARVTPRTRLAMLDSVTSPTGLVLPIGRLVRELGARGVETLVDAAHAPGMIPLDVAGLGAAYLTGNCHKWLCAPKGSAFLHVRRDCQAAIRPLAISHGANSPRRDRSRFRLEFDWTGTADVTPYLCVPEAIRFLGSLFPGGWTELMARNRALALQGRDRLCHALDAPPPCPDEMIGSLAALPLPATEDEDRAEIITTDPLMERLYEEFRIEVPVIVFPPGPRRLIRISAQVYNSARQYDRLAAALAQIL